MIKDKVRITVEVNPRLKERLINLAEEKETTISNLMRQILNEYVDEYLECN